MSVCECDHLAYTDRFVESSEGLFLTASAQNLTPEKKKKKKSGQVGKV